MSDDKNTKKIQVALLSSVASFGMATFKFIVGAMTGSMGILAEAIHSLVDFFATVITYFAVKLSSEPADHNHHYGHEKGESLASLIATGLLFGTSFWIIYEIVTRFLEGHSQSAEVTWYAILVIILSIVIDYNRSRALMRVAKETKSEALEADALHFSSDMYSSMAVLIGLVCTSFGFLWADSLAAGLVAFMIFRAGFELAQKSLATLMDEAPAGVREEISRIVLAVPGVVSVCSVKARPLGGGTFSADLHIISKSHVTLKESSSIKKSIISHVTKKFPEGKIRVHMDSECDGTC